MPTLNKQLKREQLLDQGVSLLMEQGYHGTGLKKILDTVQIPKGSFYHYFESKEAFGAEVITHYINPFIVQLSGHLNNPELDGLSALNAYFGELVTELGRGDFKGGCLLGNLMGEIGDTSDICRASLKQAVRRYRDLLALGLAKAQLEGTVRTDKTAERLADLLVNAWQGALLRMKIEQSVVPVKDCCEDLLGDYFKA
ncbi:MAG: TetR family transcriptional regulator [Methylococcaceae bacterium]|nr:TetR family transcriptional regulator [Methylococcaceae bacterium]